MNIKIFAASLGAVLIVYLFFSIQSNKEPAPISQASTVADSQVAAVAVSNPPQPVFILNDVPFTPQAPDGNWKNKFFEEGCEEASILMAVKWAKGETLSQAEAIKEITAISNYENAHLGTSDDRSAKDTAELVKEYFGYEHVAFKADIGASDIIAELKNGSVVIVPTNGIKLHNPYYTPPGPPKHMLLIIGYDEKKDEFITNDSGTKHGLHYRYPTKVVEDAIQDYTTGNNLPIVGLHKNMIVISRP